MEWPPFYRTAMGRDFFDRRLPDLIRAVERLAAALERVASVGESAVLSTKRAKIPEGGTDEHRS